MSKQNRPTNGMKSEILAKSTGGSSSSSSMSTNRKIVKTVSVSSTKKKATTSDTNKSSIVPATKSKTQPITKQPSVHKAPSQNSTVAAVASSKDKAKITTAAIKNSSSKVAVKRSDSVPVPVKNGSSSRAKPAAHSNETKTRSVDVKRDENRAVPAIALRTTKHGVSGPMKASHSVKVPIQSNVRAQQSISKTYSPAANVASTSQRNVMNQIHNVTVTSPPPIRREIETVREIEPTSSDEYSMHRRSRTRTLEKDEIILLRGDRSSTQLQPNIVPPTPAMPSPMNVTVEVKQPISFEVKFDERPADVEEDENYEDDFDSYESDFEEASATSSEATTSASKSSSATAADSSEDDIHDDGDDDDDDEEKSRKSSDHPASTIKSSRNSASREEERQLDSGAFELKPPDMNINNIRPVDEAHSFDERDTLSETQNDSGIEYYMNAKSPTFGNSTSWAANSETKAPVSNIDDNTTRKQSNQSPFYKRGNDLLKKITLDTMTYVLYDFKPIAYEHFMHLYGKSNAVQTSTQTHNNHVSQDVQTENVSVATMWTQFPINYGIAQLTAPDAESYKRGHGNALYTNESFSIHHSEYLNDSIRKLNGLIGPSAAISNNKKRMANHVDDKINHSELNRFLQEALVTISTLLAKTKATSDKIEGETLTSRLRFAAESQLNDLKAIRVHAQANLTNFLFTLHRNETSRMNTIAVWNPGQATRPIFILSSWCNIECFEVHANMKRIVIAGLEDGSVALWDLIEEHYWHPKCDDGERRYTPSEIVTPMVADAATNHNKRFDHGKIVAIRCVYTNVDADLLDGYNPIQIFSLHEYGLLTLWTLIESPTMSNDVDVRSQRIEHHSAWGNVKLIQSYCIELRTSIETFVRKKFRKRPVSGFKKTQSYFENDLFNDAVLKELQEANNKDDYKILTKFSCIAMEVSVDSVFVATNENFLLHARKSLRSHRAFHKIQIDDEPSRRHATALLSISNRNGDDILLVGLSDGTIKSYRLARSMGQNDTFSEDDESLLSMPSTALPSPHSSKINENMHVPEPSASPTDGDADPMLGKSCIIQNIVAVDRYMNDEYAMRSVDDRDEMRLALFGAAVGDTTNRIDIFARNLLNDQTMFNGITLETNANNPVRKLLYSDELKRIFVLRSNSINIYNLIDNTEHVFVTSKKDWVADRRGDAILAVELEEGRTLADIAIVSTGQRDDVLVILGTNNDITLHALTS